MGKRNGTDADGGGRGGQGKLTAQVGMSWRSCAPTEARDAIKATVEKEKRMMMSMGLVVLRSGVLWCATGIEKEKGGEGVEYVYPDKQYNKLSPQVANNKVNVERRPT